MLKTEAEIIIGKLHSSDNYREFLDGSSRVYECLNSAAIGLGTYLPGWRWSTHAGAQTGKPSERHIGYIISGKFIIQSPSGEEKLVGPGDAFEMGPNHDAWVVGDEPSVALDFTHIEQQQ